MPSAVASRDLKLDPWVMPSSNFYATIFDLIFFSIFAIGWLITYILHPDFIHDNPIQRAFHGNNLCIGIDWGAANIVALALIGMNLWPITMFAQITYYKLRLLKVKNPFWTLHLVTLVLGYVFTCMFLLAPGTKPEFDDPGSVYIHTTGFAMGCMGYSMLRCADAMLFWVQYPSPWSKRYKFYFSLLTFSSFWLGINGIIIIRYLLTEDIATFLKEPYVGHTGDHGLLAGPIPKWQTIWTIVAAAGPFLRWIAMPPDLDRLQVSPILEETDRPVGLEVQEDRLPAEPCMNV
jgi:hypothetical protein